MHQTPGESSGCLDDSFVTQATCTPPKPVSPRGMSSLQLGDRSGSQDRSGLETYRSGSWQPEMVFQALEAETPFLPILTRVDSEVCSAHKSRAEDESATEHRQQVSEAAARLVANRARQ